jgi:pantothenate synthetase
MIEGVVKSYIHRMRKPEIDYVAVVNEATLEQATDAAPGTRILVVARVEGVRLLDTVRLD